MRTAACAGLILFSLCARAGFAQLAPPPDSAADKQAENHPVAAGDHQKTLGDFLKPENRPDGPEVDSIYAKVPPELDKAVRYIAMDNFTSAAEELELQEDKIDDDFQVARINLWRGINYALHAYYYPDEGPELATSATYHLQRAINISQEEEVMEAPDATRLLAEMAGHGWTTADPAAELQEAEQRAEKSRRAIDFYYAGVISRRLAARAWAHSDTAEQDQKTLSLFAKAVARDPDHYESWSAYLPAMLPVGMHDVATTEAARMYEHFKMLRTPLLADQGPAVLKINTSSYRTMKDDEDMLAEVAARWPDAPMPHFEMAMRAIESTPTQALVMFSKLIEQFENGTFKPLPREAGYYPSALYKYAFLLQTVERTSESLAMYRKVKALSPDYAEVNLNIGILLAQLSDKEKDGGRKVALLNQALESVIRQKNYRGKSAEKADSLTERIKMALKAQMTTAPQ